MIDFPAFVLLLYTKYFLFLHSMSYGVLMSIIININMIALHTAAFILYGINNVIYDNPGIERKHIQISSDGMPGLRNRSGKGNAFAVGTKFTGTIPAGSKKS